jgi:hypothetical protein
MERVHTGILYQEYTKLWNYRRLHPELQSDPTMIRLFDAGHTTTYADILWMSVIQYLADNLRNNEYLTFLNPLLENITSLHPHFTRPYIFGSLMTPTLNPDNLQYLPTNREKAQKALALAEL